MDEFQPDWASPPADTIRDLMEEVGWGVEECACAVGISIESLQAILDGEPIDTVAAQGLAKATGTSVEFWLNREAQYRRDLKRLKIDMSR